MDVLQRTLCRWILRSSDVLAMLLIVDLLKLGGFPQASYPFTYMAVAAILWGHFIRYLAMRESRRPYPTGRAS